MTTRLTPHALVEAALLRVAPDVDANDLDADLHDDLGLDSMDLLNLAAAISASSHIEIPERDFPGLRTLRQLEEYLAQRLANTTEVSP
ncbi:MAG: phosphopantetheine-binding protein [Ilumatobacteraceae bacterium]